MIKEKKEGFCLEKMSGTWLIVAGTVVMVLITFRNLLASSVVLFSTDNNIGAESLLKAVIPDSFIGGWNDSELLGSGGILPVAWSYVLLWLSPLRMYMNWIHALDLALGSLFLVYFLRQRMLGWGAAALAGLGSFWVGSNMTLVYSGHNGKFAVMMLAAVALWLIERAVQTKSWQLSVLIGGVVGLAFNEQPDFALFVCLFVGAYYLFALIREEGVNYKSFARLFLPCVAVIVLVAGPGAIGSYFSFVKGVVAVSEEDPQAKWEFCTQWSLPSDETIDLIAPGYMGLRSGEPEGPYWGRTGRSAGWERTHQGFMNFRLDSIYIGAIPIILALFAILAALLGRSESQFFDVKKRRYDVFFWGTVFIISLLLSYGKYFPLYGLFYQLPMMSNIRNPIKFIVVFQVAVGILAAYGLDYAIKKSDEKGTN